MSGLQLAFKAEDLFLGVPDPITLTLSVLVLLVSAASALAAWRANSRQSQRQERLVNIETAREQDRQRLARSAEVRASIVHGERRFMEQIVPQYMFSEGVPQVRARFCHLLYLQQGRSTTAAV